MMDMWEPLAFILAIMISVAAAIAGAGYVGNRIECASFYEATGMKTKQVGFECYVEIDGKFVPMSLYKKAFERNISIKVNQ